MPVQSPRKERPLIELFLSAYDNDSYKGCLLEWLEDKQDGAVEVLATNRAGETLAIEHTLIEPFVGEKQDSNRFLKAFLRLEGDSALVVPERDIDIGLPVGGLPTRYDWNAIGEEIRTWLGTCRHSLPEGMSKHICTVGTTSKNESFTLTLTVWVTSNPDMPGHCRIARYGVPENLGDVVERALKTKLPKLVGTPAGKHILMLERDQMFPSELQIYVEIEKRKSDFPALNYVDEIWIANTVGLETEQYVSLALIDRRGLVELLSFHDGRLTQRRNDRACLPPL